MRRYAVKYFGMKHKQDSQEHNRQDRPNASALAKAAALTRNEIDLVPSRDEVARIAYFKYVNQGSLPGHEMQHWLDAEAELIAERNRSRDHGLHNRT